MFAFLYLVDNVALTLREAQGAYTLNLYRGREVGPFDDDDLVSLNVLVPPGLPPITTPRGGSEFTASQRVEATRASRRKPQRASD